LGAVDDGDETEKHYGGFGDSDEENDTVGDMSRYGYSLAGETLKDENGRPKYDQYGFSTRSALTGTSLTPQDNDENGSSAAGSMPPMSAFDRFASQRSKSIEGGLDTTEDYGIDTIGEQQSTSSAGERTANSNRTGSRSSRSNHSSIHEEEDDSDSGSESGSETESGTETESGSETESDSEEEGEDDNESRSSGGSSRSDESESDDEESGRRSNSRYSDRRESEDYGLFIHPSDTSAT